MKNTIRINSTLLIFLIISACVPASQPVISTPAPSTDIPFETSSPTENNPATSTITQTALIEKTATKTITLTPTSSIPRIEPPPGLTYSFQDKIWEIDEDHMPVMFAEGLYRNLSPDGNYMIDYYCSGETECSLLTNLVTGETKELQIDSAEFSWSPDSSQLYYQQYDQNLDIWVYDLVADTYTNLTHTPQREEWLTSFSTAYPKKLIFESWESEVNPYIGAGWYGYLTIMDTDGNNYEVISKDNLHGDLALSPDGNMLAYSDGKGAWLYNIRDGLSRFPIERYGLKNETLISPAWSPDGQWIAWWLDIENDKRSYTFNTVGVFSINGSQYHFYEGVRPVMVDGPPSPVSWSPDSQALVFYAGRDFYSPHGYWLARPTSDNRQFILALADGHIYNPCWETWSPDSQQLALSCNDAAIEDGIWILDVTNGDLQLTNLPANAYIREWALPEE